MIFLLDKRHRYTIASYLESRRCGELADRIGFLSYEELLTPSRIPQDTYIFCDHERMNPEQIDLAISVWCHLANCGKPVRLLNDPAKVLRRISLLKTLFELGRSAVQAVRAPEPCDGLRFPVFIRREDEHTGSLTPLLYSPQQVERALAKLTPSFPTGRSNLLVVEFCDTSGGTGTYRKYSAFKVGERILPRYLTSSTDWQVKSFGPPKDSAAILEEWQFFNENPHEAWVREMFEIAHIDYGRIDYGLLNGQPQIWEINTNPMLSGLPDRIRGPRPELPKDIEELREKNREYFHERFRARLQAIDGDRATGATIPIAIDRPNWHISSQSTDWSTG